jgi:hypothetical protein
VRTLRFAAKTPPATADVFRKSRRVVSSDMGESSW